MTCDAAYTVKQLDRRLADNPRMSRPIAYHAAFHLSDSRVIAPTPEQRRHVARIILEQFRDGRLLCFNVPDTHIHLEHAESEEDGAERIRRIKIKVVRQLALPVGFAPADEPKPIESQGHLRQAFVYILRQQPRHGLRWDPYHEASNLSDLLGLRITGAHTIPVVRQLLPRINRSLLLELLGVSELCEEARAPHLLLEAARAASGLTDLRRRTPQIRAVWRAILALTEDHLTLRQVAELLALRRETLSRIKRTASIDPILLRAIRLQLGLRQALPDRFNSGFAGADIRPPLEPDTGASPACPRPPAPAPARL